MLFLKIKAVTVLGSIIVLVVLLSGFILRKPRFLSQTSTPPTPQSTITQISTTNWTKYDDPVLGFSIRFPPKWFIYPTPSEGYAKTTILSNFDLQTAKATEGQYTTGQLKINFSVSQITVKAFSDLENTIRDYLHPMAEDTLFRQIEIGDNSGIRADFTLFDQKQISIFIPLQTKLFFVNVVPVDASNVTLIEEILKTIELK